MAKLAIVKAGGKQYLVTDTQELVVGKIKAEAKDIELEMLATFNEDGSTLELGAPVLSTLAKAQIVEELKGEKVRVAKFKAKTRYRKVRGFRPQLSKIKIVSL